ncbi:hypothetical protein N431DRAFT_350052 [Stipitochalara longipes BDJ]|nr:hypothetical protein N431DRAFT_350052 [Stipitochalara longipes BDJ]
MRFLCLPGAYGSAKNFEVQLAPFCKELSSDGSTTFFFTQGTVECTPPPGFQDYFGPGPHYRFVDYDGIQGNDVLERVRDFPEGESPEDVMRELLPVGEEGVRSSVRKALDIIYRTMDEHGPFDGICAYSEGTVMGGSLILDELRRYETEGRPRQIKMAVFFAGWPPLKPESDEILLVDTCEDFIDVPTLHCIGATDPYVQGARALFDVCDPDSAILFDHGKGHTIPRDAQTLKELSDAIRRLIPGV